MTDYAKMAGELREVGKGRTEGPWEYTFPRRDEPDFAYKFDDWGTIREPINDDGWRPIITRLSMRVGDEELSRHRENKTDPVEADARFIAHCGTHADAIAAALEEAGERIKELEGENMTLKNALAPFAIEANRFGDKEFIPDDDRPLIAHPLDLIYGDDDDWIDRMCLSDALFTVGDLRTARAALKEPKP